MKKIKDVYLDYLQIDFVQTKKIFDLYKDDIKNPRQLIVNAYDY